jgi:dolichol-phosphate mannosyltransferase
MLLSVVVPAYNEAQNIAALVAALRSVLTSAADLDYEILFIDDGSTDDTRGLLRGYAESDPRIKVLAFSRNFGHQAAITAGLDFAEGDAVVVMDADLQDPPELLLKMIELYHQGYDVVSAQRVSRAGDSLLKRVTARGFYWMMRKMVDKRLVPEVGDFRLFSHAAVVLIRNFREQHRFMRGLVAWLGLKEAIVPMHRQPRHAGQPKYSALRMLKFAWTAVCSFSALPLRISLAGGCLLSLLSAGGLFYAAYSAWVAKHALPGWVSLALVQGLFAGSILIAIGLVGDYLARIYEEAKDRPLYIVGSHDNVRIELLHARRALIVPDRAPEPKVFGAKKGT